MILSIASSQSCLVAVVGSTPSAFITSGTVSRISVSISTWPLYWGSKRSLTDFTSGASAVLTTSPVIPLCQGSENDRSGSKDGLCRLGTRLSIAGLTASWSKSWR